MSIVEMLDQHQDNERGLFNANNMFWAIKYGHYQIAKFLFHKRVDKDGFTVAAIQEAAKCPDYELLELLVSRWAPNQRNPAIDSAAAYGRLNNVVLLHTKGYCCTREAMHSAAIKGYYDIVVYLQNNRLEGCQKDTMQQTISNGHIDVALFLAKSRPVTCGITDYTDLLARHAPLPVLQRLIKEGVITNLTQEAMLAQDIGTLEYVHNTFSLRYNQGCMDIAAKHGNLELIQFLSQQKVEPSDKCLEEAARAGHLEVVQYLHDTFPMLRTSCAAMNDAAGNGHLSVVQFLHERRTEGCTTLAMSKAIMNGHRQVVDFLILNRSEGYHIYDLVERDGKPNSMKWLCRSDSLEYLQLLNDRFKESFISLSLHYIIESGRHDIIRYLHNDNHPLVTKATTIHKSSKHHIAGYQINEPLLEYLRSGTGAERLESSYNNRQDIRQYLYDQVVNPVGLEAAELVEVHRAVMLLKSMDPRGYNKLLSDNTMSNDGPRGTSLEVLKYLHPFIGHPYLYHVQLFAKHGDLASLMFLHCNTHSKEILKSQVLKTACKQGHLNIVKFLTSWDNRLRMYISEALQHAHNHPIIKDYLNSQL
ncbi:hypothetical protein SAMD00019534_014190, partial [Acytostelium subglobosum LB1]|uniref:hypothetical protein n=1 Tax=Acytostelium subglobosum LB1 TaxID=1410327 RepID=UPI000644BA63